MKKEELEDEGGETEEAVPQQRVQQLLEDWPTKCVAFVSKIEVFIFVK